MTAGRKTGQRLSSRKLVEGEEERRTKKKEGEEMMYSSCFNKEWWRNEGWKERRERKQLPMGSLHIFPGWNQVWVWTMGQTTQAGWHSPVIKHYLPALRLEKELRAQVRQCDKDQSGITVTLQRQAHLQCLSENPVNLFLPVNLQQNSASRCFTATH